MIPDEHLITFRLDEALRHLREAEKLIPENTKQWRFLLGAQTAVEAVQQLQREQSCTEKRWERSEIEHRRAAVEALREFGGGILAQDFTDDWLGKIVDCVLATGRGEDE